jgi:hypothetical protein
MTHTLPTPNDGVEVCSEAFAVLPEGSPEVFSVSNFIGTALLYLVAYVRSIFRR